MVNAFTGSNLFGQMFSDKEVGELFSAPAFTRRMLEFEAAWTCALAKEGTVSGEDADAALSAIDAFDADLSGGSERDGLPVPELVRVLREGLGEGPSAAIHTGATSQDVVDTAMVLTLLDVADAFEERLSRVLSRIEALHDTFGNRPLTARTRMQAALPATVRLRLSAWRMGVSEQLDRVGPLREEIGVVQIGGPIGHRDLPQGVVDAVAADLGLALGPVWQSGRSRMVSFGHWLSLVAGTLGKIGQDIVLMAQQGVDEIALATGGGSSAMPHKSNPVKAEAMVALARYVAGQQGILAQAMVHEQERSGAAWALEWLSIPAMAEGTGASLAHAEALLASIRKMGGD